MGEMYEIEFRKGSKLKAYPLADGNRAMYCAYCGCFAGIESRGQKGEGA